MTIAFSRRLAIVFGILTPLAETVRRWHQLSDIYNWSAWLDDFFLGGFLLYGAWRTGQNARAGQRYLAAAWGFTCGMAYGSFFSQLERLRLHEIDPAPIPSVWVAVIKGIGFVLALMALVVSLKRLPEGDH